MKFLVLAVILIVSPIFICQDCTTPLDCYLKAYAQLQKDREEMRGLKTRLEDLIINKAKIIEEEVNARITNITSQMKADFQSQIDALVNKTALQVSEINSSVAKVYDVVEELKQVNQNRHFLYKDAEVHHDIFSALEKGIIVKMGSPSGWDDTTYRVNPWNKRKMLRIGINFQTNGNGMSTVVPEGANTLWLRVSNDIFEVFRLKFLDGNQEEEGKFACGKRSLNEFSPDGGAPDSNDSTHMWCNLPLRRSGKIAVYTDRDTQGWISGIAFGKNLWSHARNSAVAYHWNINGGNGVGWSADNWNNDQLAFCPAGVICELNVPVISSGNDKLLYLVEHNNNWMGTMHSSIHVNGVLIERFRTSYQNPFSTHYNSKFYERYIAAKIPKDLIKEDAKFINVKIDMTSSSANLNFREVGTHDYFY